MTPASYTNPKAIRCGTCVHREHQGNQIDGYELFCAHGEEPKEKDRPANWRNKSKVHEYGVCGEFKKSERRNLWTGKYE